MARRLPREVTILGQADYLVYRPARSSRTLRLRTPGILVGKRREILVLRPVGAAWSRARASSHARSLYTRWHREQPDAIARMRVRLSQPRVLGRVVQIGYTYFGRRKRHGEPRYHDFPTPPRLTQLGGGNFRIAGGRFSLTYRGIVG